MDKFDWLTERIGEALQQLLNSGFKLPIYAAVVSRNGSVLFMRYSQSWTGAGLDAKILTSRDMPEGYGLPINIMFTDFEGAAARVLIQNPDHYELFSFVGHA